ncbi:hypothetical protein SDC9_193756 [bioreactor metagenome]|uniref:Uncharacterized protein n=1 Tax=bioreactor metagenome TaxID=1076179 RepID=A0A645IFM4_9ZZZZ
MSLEEVAEAGRHGGGAHPVTFQALAHRRVVVIERVLYLQLDRLVPERGGAPRALLIAAAQREREVCRQRNIHCYYAESHYSQLFLS